MSPLTAILVLSVGAALLTVGCGMPRPSKIFFPDDDDQIADQTADQTAPRHSRQRWAARPPATRPGPLPSTGRNFYFPDEEVEKQPPPVVPDRKTGRPGDKTTAEEETNDSKPETGRNSSAKVETPEDSLEWFPIPSCGNVEFSSYNNATGDCVKLWTDSEAGCEPGSWFVVDPTSREASCLPRPCPAGEAMFDDVCWSISDAQNGPCAAGQGGLLNQFGDGLCDCLSLHVYWPEEARCYWVYQRGPCAAGEHLVVPPTGARAVCEPTQCQDGEVLWEDPALDVPLRCYSTPQFRDDDPCAPGGQLLIDPRTLTVSCQYTQLHSVWEIQQLECPPGSARNFHGGCPDTHATEQKFRYNQSQCPDGYIAGPNGVCKPTSSMGG